MADYYPLISRAIAGLEKNTGEARRALYERARTALVAQLRGVNPPLQESEITRERLALEEAIRKVEADSARRTRADAQTPPPAAPAPGAPRPGAAPRFPNAVSPAPGGSPAPNRPMRPTTPAPAPSSPAAKPAAPPPKPPQGPLGAPRPSAP